MSWKATAATKPITHDRKGRKLNQGEKLALLLLADSTDPRTERAYPSQQTLAAQALCSKRTLQRHLQRVADGGLLRIGGPGGRGGNWYELTYVKPEVAQKGDKMTPFQGPKGGHSCGAISSVENPVTKEKKGDKMTPLPPKKGDIAGEKRRHYGSEKTTQLCRVSTDVSIYEPKEPKEPNKTLPVLSASSDSSEEKNGTTHTAVNNEEGERALRRKLEQGVSRRKLFDVYDDSVIGQARAGGDGSLTELVARQVLEQAVTLLLLNRGFVELGGRVNSDELTAAVWPRIAKALPAFAQVADYTRRKHVFGASVINCVVSAALELRGGGEP